MASDHGPGGPASAEPHGFLVTVDEIDRIVRETEAELLDRGYIEAPSTVIGETVLEKLKDLDQVAYIRFASVYREFRDLDDWRREMAVLDRRREQAHDG